MQEDLPLGFDKLDVFPHLWQAKEVWLFVDVKEVALLHAVQLQKKEFGSNPDLAKEKNAKKYLGFSDKNVDHGVHFTLNAR